MYRRIAAAVFVIISIAVLGSKAEAEPKAGRKTVLLMVDCVNLDDLAECSSIRTIMEQGYTALVNNRQPGRPSQNKAKLILGSGKRIDFDNDFLKDGNIAAVKDRYNGYSIIYPGIDELKNSAQHSEYQRFIGYLGDAVLSNGGDTCILGNSDTDKPGRGAIFAAMDSRGVVSRGEVSDILKKDSSFPYGIRTDYKRLAELYKQFLPASSFVVIDTGDMERLEAYRTNMEAEEYSSIKSKVLRNIDVFAAGLLENGGFETLILISTYPSAQNYKKNDRLTPVIVFDRRGRGVLYSNSTRREGIILNTDIADYILYKLGYPNKNNITEIKMDNSWTKLKEMNKEIIAVSRLRLPVLSNYAVFVIVSLILLVVALVYTSGKRSIIIEKSVRIIACMNLSIPLVLLYMPLFKLFNVYLYILLVFFQSLLISWVIDGTMKRGTEKIMALNLVLFSCLSLDLLFGGKLIRQSVLGYDAIIGARFYGIGNEYAGVFIGCSIILLGCFADYGSVRLQKAYTIIYLILCSGLLGLTMLGANFGGALAGLVGYILAYHLIYDIQFNWKHMMFIIALCAAVIALLVVVDLSGVSSTSHLGRFAKDISESGIKVLLSTIQRKLEMNLRLIKYTIWTKVLFFIVLTIAFMLYKPVKPLESMFKRYRHLKCSWIAASAASVAGFLVNDSGIVMAATAMIYVVFTMLPLSVERGSEV